MANSSSADSPANSKASNQIHAKNENREGGHVLVSQKTLSTAPRSGGSAVSKGGLSEHNTASYLGKHLSDQVQEDKTTHVLPPTTGIAGKVESEGTHETTASGSIRRNIKATVLTFRAIVDRPSVARVQLLLCNISDRALYFKLKSNVGSNVSALPAGDGEIHPHAQVRLILTWTRPSQYEHWRDVPPPKLLITTRFMDAQSDADVSTTSIRLIARVSTSKTCYASNPPVEQLLLDAIGKSENMEVSSVMHEAADKGHDLRHTAKATNVVDVLNGLDDRGLFILILILLAVMYIVSKLCDKSAKQRYI